MPLLYCQCQRQKHQRTESTTTTFPINEPDNTKSKFLQNIERAQTHLTDRLIKNMKYVKLSNGHFWSELVIYKRNRFNQWRCLTCCKIMGKKDRHRNAVLYPEYFTTFTDDNYIDADGDDEHHGHSAHVYARQYLRREREAQQAIVQTKEKTKCL